MKRLIFIALLLVPGLLFAQDIFKFNAITGQLDLVTTPPVISDSLNTNLLPVEVNPDTAIVKTKTGHKFAKAPIISIAGFQAFSAYGTGTLYNLTATPALITFGGGGAISPSITLGSAGTYTLFITGGLKAVGYSKATISTATIKVRRTNNTPSDIAECYQTITIPVASLLTDHISTIALPVVLYTTANTTDILQVWASVDVVGTAGTITVSQCGIIAIRQY